MARDCEACERLQEDAPELLANGVTDRVCASLQNNTGFDTTNGNNDATDLHNANDCLIGNLEDEVERYDVCDWKDFMKRAIPNLYNLLKAIICTLAGIWLKLELTSYLGVLTLYRSSAIDGSGSGNQAPAFNTNVRQGNIPSSVLQVASDYKGIVVKNTTSVPLLVEATFTCSIHTDQHLASCFIVITKDGARIGQAPFITPDTYDQQAIAEPFILQPGKSATLRYYFRVGDANKWFRKQFGGTYAKCRLDPNDSTNPENQRSYFSVKVTSLVEMSGSAGTN